MGTVIVENKTGRIAAKGEKAKRGNTGIQNTGNDKGMTDGNTKAGQGTALEFGVKPRRIVAVVCSDA